MKVEEDFVLIFPSSMFHGRIRRRESSAGAQSLCFLILSGLSEFESFNGRRSQQLKGSVEGIQVGGLLSIWWGTLDNGQRVMMFGMGFGPFHSVSRVVWMV